MENLENITRVDGWSKLIQAIRNNSPVIETSARCISPICLLDFLSPTGLMDKMYLEIEEALKNSSTTLLIGEYACKTSERIASKFSKTYKGRNQEYIEHSLEAE